MRYLSIYVGGTAVLPKYALLPVLRFLPSFTSRVYPDLSRILYFQNLPLSSTNQSGKGGRWFVPAAPAGRSVRGRAGFAPGVHYDCFCA